MRITCPNCTAHFEIPTELLGKKGRSLKCASCGHSWYQTAQVETLDIADIMGQDYAERAKAVMSGVVAQKSPMPGQGALPPGAQAPQMQQGPRGPNQPMVGAPMPNSAQSMMAGGAGGVQPQAAPMAGQSWFQGQRGNQMPGGPQAGRSMMQQVPGMPQGMPPGMPPGMPGAMGAAPGMPLPPGMMPGMPPGMPPRPGQPGAMGAAPGMPGMMPGQVPGLPPQQMMPGAMGAPGMPPMPGMPGQSMYQQGAMGGPQAAALAQSMRSGPQGAQAAAMAGQSMRGQAGAGAVGDVAVSWGQGGRAVPGMPQMPGQSMMGQPGGPGQRPGMMPGQPMYQQGAQGGPQAAAMAGQSMRGQAGAGAVGDVAVSWNQNQAIPGGPGMPGQSMIGGMQGGPGGPSKSMMGQAGAGAVGDVAMSWNQNQAIPSAPGMPGQPLGPGAHGGPQAAAMAGQSLMGQAGAGAVGDAAMSWNQNQAIPSTGIPGQSMMGQPGGPGQAGQSMRDGATGGPGQPGQSLRGADGAPGAAGQSIKGAEGGPGQPGQPMKGADGAPGAPGQSTKEAGATGGPGQAGAAGGPGQPGAAGGPGQPGAAGGPGQEPDRGDDAAAGAAGGPGKAKTDAELKRADAKAKADAELKQGDAAAEDEEGAELFQGKTDEDADQDLVDPDADRPDFGGSAGSANEDEDDFAEAKAGMRSNFKRAQREKSKPLNPAYLTATVTSIAVIGLGALLWFGRDYVERAWPASKGFFEKTGVAEAKPGDGLRWAESSKRVQRISGVETFVLRGFVSNIDKVVKPVPAMKIQLLNEKKEVIQESPEIQPSATILNPNETVEVELRLELPQLARSKDYRIAWAGAEQEEK
jgi:predicted Zn finger-like uncharacterized protein